MSTAILMCALFFAKVVDNALSTTKTILVQRNHCILAGIALAASNFIYLCITKNVVNSDIVNEYPIENTYNVNLSPYLEALAEVPAPITMRKQNCFRIAVP